MAPKGITGWLGLSDVTDNKIGLGKALLAEALGVFFINYFGCLSCNSKNVVIIAFSFGLTVFVLVQSLGHVSGGHFNPAITIGMLITGRTKIIRGILYIIAQCIGAICGSAILLVLLPEKVPKSLGLTNVTEATADQGMGLEFVLGFILVFVVFSVTDPNKPFEKIMAPLAIGLTVVVGHLTSVDFTGSSMNPARSVGVSVISGEWMNQWIYWVGPCLGGIVASLLYTHVFAAPQIGDYTPVNIVDKELKRLDGKDDGELP